MRPLSLLAVVLLAVSGLAAPALAQDAEDCGPESVTVVVDAEMLDGDLDVRCVDAGDGATVLDAATDAGFVVEGTAEFGSAIVCRVDGAPDETREPCDAMPAADAYWISWVGSGAGWEYAQEAVNEQAVAAGDVVALAFQDGPEERQPAVSPQEAADTAQPVSEDGQVVESSEGPSWLSIGLGAVAVVLLALVLVWFVRRRPSA
jgi:hypothetical protein